MLQGLAMKLQGADSTHSLRSASVSLAQADSSAKKGHVEHTGQTEMTERQSALVSNKQELE